MDMAEKGTDFIKFEDKENNLNVDLWKFLSQTGGATVHKNFGVCQVVSSKVQVEAFSNQCTTPCWTNLMVDTNT